TKSPHFPYTTLFRSITLSNEDKVVSMSLCEERTDVLVVSENGFGKRTDINEYRTQIRAGKGIKTYNIAEKTGKLVGAEMVNEDRSEEHTSELQSRFD